MEFSFSRKLVFLACCTTAPSVTLIYYFNDSDRNLLPNEINQKSDSKLLHKSHSIKRNHSQNATHLDSAELRKKKENSERVNLSKKNSSPFYDGNAPLPYYLTSADGRITTGAAQAANLTDDDKRNIQDVIDRAFKSAEEDVLSRIKQDVAGSNPDKGVTVFRIPASPDRAEKILSDLHTSILNVVGEEKGSMLAKSFDVNQGILGLGKKDVKLEIRVPAQGATGITLIKYEFTNPDTGQFTGGGESSIRSFKSRFGNIIDFGDN